MRERDSQRATLFYWKSMMKAQHSQYSDYMRTHARTLSLSLPLFLVFQHKIHLKEYVCIIWTCVLFVRDGGVGLDQTSEGSVKNLTYFFMYRYTFEKMGITAASVRPSLSGIKVLRCLSHPNSLTVKVYWFTNALGLLLQVLIQSEFQVSRFPP